MSDNIAEAAQKSTVVQPDPAKALTDWARIQLADTGLQKTKLDTATCDIPQDASQQTIEKILQKMIGQWIRFQAGNGWRLVSDVHVSAPTQAFDYQRLRPREGVRTYQFTGAFEATA